MKSEERPCTHRVVYRLDHGDRTACTYSCARCGVELQSPPRKAKVVAADSGGLS